MSDRGGTSLRLRSAVFAVLGIVLVWLVLTRSLVAFLADGSPEAALGLRSDDATALINLSEVKLNLQRPTATVTGAIGEPGEKVATRIPGFARYPGKEANGTAEPTDTSESEVPIVSERVPSNAADPVVREEIRALVRAALAQDPLNSRALRIMGQLADAAEDEELAVRLMRAAARRSLRESVAVFWLMRESFERKDYATALWHADVLLRTRPQVMRQVMPTLASIAEDAGANQDLKKLLAANPPWRAAFFSSLLGHIKDARTPLDLMLSIKETAAAPTTTELREYLQLLMANKFHELAYYAWLQFLPQDQLSKAGMLFNGSFEAQPSGLPFDWVIAAGRGVTVDFARRPDQPGQRALLVEFGHGRVEFKGVSQVTMLAPGTYELSGQYAGELSGRRGLEWRIFCFGAKEPLAKSAMVTGAVPKWTDFTVKFKVPATADCRAQTVMLWLDVRSASEQLITGQMWYDKLQIARAE